jgi:GxxExxY protein
MDANKTTEIVIGAAIEVHRALAPGLLESTYDVCLAYELTERGGLKVERQKALPVEYRGEAGADSRSSASFIFEIVRRAYRVAVEFQCRGASPWNTSPGQ